MKGTNMYNLKVNFSWDTYEYNNVILDFADIKDRFTVVFTEDLESVKGLILDMQDEKNNVGFTFNGINSQHIYPHCKIKDVEYQENMTVISVYYGSTN